VSAAGPSEIRRVDFGSFTRPAAETGTGEPRIEALLGYVVVHPEGLVLFDTGMGLADDETEAWYQPRRIALDEALATAGVRRDEIALVANCHLHLDHCGGNPSFAARPILVQRSELEAARQPEYTVSDLIDHEGVRYEELDGVTEVLPGVTLWSTPGHTTGHQSLVARLDDGTIVLAGQTHAGAAEFATAAADPDPGGWVRAILDLDPRRVLFAHDAAVWEP
jgi:glyoxylase-like metal-dependent hydrolase (beta-lactamase superfamily II)